MFETETLYVVGGGVIAVLLGLFAVYAILEDDLNEASRKTSKRAVGVTTGAGSLATAALILGVELVAQLPELALTAIGVWAIVQDVNVSVFLAVAVVVYVTAEAVSGLRAGNW